MFYRESILTTATKCTNIADTFHSAFFSYNLQHCTQTVSLMEICRLPSSFLYCW